MCGPVDSDGIEGLTPKVARPLHFISAALLPDVALHLELLLLRRDEFCVLVNKTTVIIC